MKSPKEIGEILREARQGKGLTIDKIYKATRIQPKVIEALEEGRALELLSRVYALLFLKKYAVFLDLDASGLAQSYKAFYPEEAQQNLELGLASPAINIEPQKRMAIALSAGLIFIFVFFIFFLGTRLKSSYNARRASAILALKEKEAVKDTRARGKSQAIFPIPEDRPIELLLLGTDDVWMKVEKNGKVVFEGTLKKNTTKEWSAENSLDLWVGRAEVLHFTINGKPVGKVGKGRIRNIQISRLGLKTGNKWLLKAEE